jgi:hypothetical protein
MNDTSAFTVALHGTLQRRPRPEDVAELILSGAGDLSAGERAALETAARGSLARLAHGYSSMSARFFEAVPASQQVATAQALFRSAIPMSPADCGDVERLRAFAATISAEIRKTVGASSFKNDRLNRAARREQGLDLSRRRYNKLFRFLRRFERKIDTYHRQLTAVDDQMAAKSGIVGRLTVDDLAASPEAAAFVAYYVARRNRRSVFTNQGQDPAFDDIAKALFERFKRRPHPAGWRAIAHAMPDLEVVARLGEAEKLELLTAWLEVLHGLAGRMGALWAESQFDRKTMIVARGDQSSAWNGMAGAWNIARQGWLATVTALGMDDVIDLVCLPKAMRLMAGDVASWHGALHPDTAVWALLPAPWEVISGEAACTRLDVEVACAKSDVDPVGGGWIAPRRGRRAVRFSPTPELVHGVAVSHPELAGVLRRAGWFSGGPSRPLPDGVEVAVRRDPVGAATFATYADPVTSLWKRLFGGARTGPRD